MTFNGRIRNRIRTIGSELDSQHCRYRYIFMTIFRDKLIVGSVSEFEWLIRDPDQANSGQNILYSHGSGFARIR